MMTASNAETGGVAIYGSATLMHHMTATTVTTTTSAATSTSATTTTTSTTTSTAWVAGVKSSVHPAALLPDPGFFEGAEKLLEISFYGNGSADGLRAVKRSVWEDALKLVRCEIVSHLPNEHVDAYVLRCAGRRQIARSIEFRVF